MTEANDSGCLLGYKTANQLEVIQIINNVDEDSMHKKFPDLFKGIGKYNG